MSRVQFQRITPIYSLTASYQRESANYAQVGDEAIPSPAPIGPRTEFAAGGSIALGQYGSLNAGYIENKQNDGQVFSTASITYSTNAGPAFLSLGMRRTRFVTRRDDSLFGSLTMPLGSRASVGLMMENDRLTATVQAAPPPDQEIGYRLLAGHDFATGQDSFSGAVTIRTSAGEVELSGTHHGGANDIRMTARGALIAVDGKVIAAPRLEYAFAVASVESDEEVVLYYENRPLAAKAGKGKRIIITGMQPYAANHVSVDPDTVPIEMTLDAADQIVVPGYRQAAKIRFGGAANRPISLTLIDETGRTLDAGLSVVIADTQMNPTGFGGEIFLPDAHGGERISVSGPGLTCTAFVPLLPANTALPKLDPVICTSTQTEGMK